MAVFMTYHLFFSVLIASKSIFVFSSFLYIQGQNHWRTSVYAVYTGEENRCDEMKISVLHFLTTSRAPCLLNAFGFRSEMNGGVLPRLMSQLMVFSCLISIVPSVSAGSRRPPSGCGSQRSAAGEGPRLPPGRRGPSSASASV